MFHCSVIKDRFCIAVCLKQLCYYIMSFPACQELFSTFLKLFLFLSCSNFGSISHLPLSCQELFSRNFSVFTERRRRDLNPRAATNDLLPFQGSPFSQLGYFSKNGEGGIRTHAPFRTNGFQDRLVMTTSIPLHIYNSENRLIELPLCNVRYDITCTFPMSRPYFIFYRFFCFFP